MPMLATRLKSYIPIVTCLALTHAIACFIGYRMGDSMENANLALGMLALLTVAWLPYWLSQCTGLKAKCGNATFTLLALLLWLQAGITLTAECPPIAAMLCWFLALFGSAVILAGIAKLKGDLPPSIQKLLDI